MNSPGRSADIGIIVLAAGVSRRFGGDKRRAPLPGGETLLEATLARIPSSFSKRLLVLRSGDDELAARFGSLGWRICTPPDARLGMAHSLAAAIEAANRWEGAVIGLGDMPYVRSSTYERLQEALTRHGIVVPVFGGKRGNPVGFGKEFFDEIVTLDGDRGARILLEKYRDRCFRLATEDAGIVKDIDTPEALDGKADQGE